MDIWISIASGVAGAAIGSALTALFTKRRDAAMIRIETARGLLTYLALVLNRSAPEKQAANAEALGHEWAQHSRTLFLVSVPSEVRERLDERVVAYLKSLKALHQGDETRDEVERLRDLAKQEARSFFQRMGLNADW